MTYDCAFCGEENDLYPDPSGGRRQTFTDDDGEAEIGVSQEYEA